MLEIQNMFQIEFREQAQFGQQGDNICAPELLDQSSQQIRQIKNFAEQKKLQS